MDSIKHLNIELTDYCNQACQYCFNSCNSSGNHSQYNLSTWKTALKKIKGHGLRSVHITGGEPFTHPRIIDFIQLNNELDLNVSILSNGYKIARFCKYYPEIIGKLHHAQISLDSLDEEYLSRTRGYKNALYDAVSAIIALKSLGVTVEISTVCNENREQIDNVIEFADLLNCQVIIRKIEDLGRAKDKYKSINEVEQLLINNNINCDFYLPSERLKGSKIGFWTISSNGMFLPRPYYYDYRVFRNLFDIA